MPIWLIILNAIGLAAIIFRIGVAYGRYYPKEMSPKIIFKEKKKSKECGVQFQKDFVSVGKLLLAFFNLFRLYKIWLILDIFWHFYFIHSFGLDKNLIQVYNESTIQINLSPRSPLKGQSKERRIIMNYGGYVKDEQICICTGRFNNQPVILVKYEGGLKKCFTQSDEYPKMHVFLFKMNKGDKAIKGVEIIEKHKGIFESGSDGSKDSSFVEMDITTLLKKIKEQEILTRIRQVRDALNKCRDAERIETVAKIFGV